MPEVRLLAGLRSRIGADSLPVEAGSVRELLDALVVRAGPEFAAVFYAEPDAEDPEPHRDLRVLVNGRSMIFLDGLATRVAESDKVTVHLAGARGYPGG